MKAVNTFTWKELNDGNVHLMLDFKVDGKPIGETVHILVPPALGVDLCQSLGSVCERLVGDKLK